MMNYRVKFIEDVGLLEVEIPEGSEVDVTTGGDVVIGENIVVIKNRTEVRS